MRLSGRRSLRTFTRKSPTSPKVSYWSPTHLEKLALYATPPLTPSAHRIPVFDPPLGELHWDRLCGMEGDERQRRQYDQANYPSARGYGPTSRGLPSSSSSSSSNVPDRFGQSQLLATRTEMSAPPAVPGPAAQALAYGYTQGQQYAAQPLHGSSLQYTPDFSPPDPQRQQQFPQYASNMMYNVPSQAQQQSPYESVSQYQPRQSAAIEVLSTQFGVPQYFNPSEPTSAAGPAVPQQYASAQFQQPMSYPPQQASLARSTNPSPYQSSMPDFAQPIASEALEQQELALDSSSYDDAYNQYQTALKSTFENTRSGRLIEAGHSLLEISEWLLGHAVELGLVRDEQELHSDRIKLWNEFNTCWLAVLQRQKENTQEMLDTGQPPRPPQSILQEDFLERMGRELVRLCDIMERHGLVDYQMGVWEEEIIHVLTECLDLLEGDEEDPPVAAASTQVGPSAMGSGSR